MATFFLSFIVLALVMIVMAVGFIFKKKPIKGTCASLSNLGNNGECVVCGKKPDDASCEADSLGAIRKRMYYAADKPELRVVHSSN